MGLIIGGLTVFLIAWGIVHMTNKKYEGEKAGHAAAAQTSHYLNTAARWEASCWHGRAARSAPPGVRFVE
jgi:hypothetical protein